MDKRWFLSGGVLLICGLYLLVGTERQQNRFDIWLDRHDSEATAEANALRPLVKCVNVAEVPWRLDREAGQSHRDDDFPSLQRHDYQAIKNDFCKPANAFKASLVDGTRQIGLLADRYLPALTSAQAPGLLDSVSAKPVLPERLEAQFSSVIAESDRKRHAERVQAFLPLSDTLRRELESTELALRPRQLEHLEQKLGRDMHWHLLNYMLQARLGIDRLEAAARRQRLDLPLLGSTRDELRQAQESAEAYRNALPANRRHGPVHELWSMLQQPMQQYQAALEQLASDWRNHAEPQVLSDDFWNVGHRYDVLLALYNRQADVDF
ncbi:DUF3829 domain-containing protein [Pseudomonas asplenii]|uniref:DUF3829 domain-containing protein n=1 Tax=Pseudomonas asplenii TaxID=53407 RepID=UPI0006B58E98|nr:DUF3829 domain-containing protein [Pseudomonas fuscovaginae]KPA94577.1 hypothetical protein PF70_05453 [Pseudomonas fuscovaginae]